MMIEIQVYKNYGTWNFQPKTIALGLCNSLRPAKRVTFAYISAGPAGHVLAQKNTRQGGLWKQTPTRLTVWLSSWTSPLAQASPKSQSLEERTVRSICGQETAQTAQPVNPYVPASTPSSLRNWMRVVVPFDMCVLPGLNPDPLFDKNKNRPM